MSFARSVRFALANPDHLSKLLEGPEAWNGWRRDNLGIVTVDLRDANLAHRALANANLRDASLCGAELSDADLGGANLRDADLRGANLNRINLRLAELVAAKLRDASLSWAKLNGANLRKADLQGANLQGSELSNANLSLANMSGANLTEAGLTNANLGGADFSGADLSGTSLYETIFANTNLVNVKGLDKCFHRGPSSIDYQTLSKSGQLPLPFLRGCGLPDQWIDYLPSLLNEAIQFYSCFISYSAKDEEFVKRLHADLQDKGVRCWFAPHDIQGGRKIHEQIDEAIRLYDKLLLILSQDSMSSEWVKTEISKARKREVREKRRMLFPLRLVDVETLRDWECFDADTGKDSAREIREYFIPDFSDWKDYASYQAAFQRLVTDLKAATKSRSAELTIR